MRIISLIIAGIFAALNLHASSFTNSTSGGNWTSAGSWTLNSGSGSFPVAGDVVTLSSTKGPITVNTAVACASIAVGKNLIISNPGSLTISGAITLSNSAVILIGASSSINAGSMTVSSGTVTVNGTYSSTGNVTVGISGILNLLNTASNSVSIGSFTMTGGTLNLGQSTSTANIPIPTVSGAILLSSGTIVDNITTTRALVAGLTYSNLTLKATTSASNPTYTISSTLNVTGNLLVSGSAIFSPGANTVNIGGSFSASNFTIGTSTINYNASTGSQSVGAVNYYNLNISSSATVAVTLASGTIGIANALTITNPSDITTSATNTIDYNGSVNQTILTTFPYNNIKISNSGGTTKVTIPASPILTFVGNFTANSTFDAITNSATVELSGTDAAQTISGGTFYDLSVNTSSSTNSSSITVPTGVANTVTIKNSMSIGLAGGDPGMSSFIQPNSNLIFSDNSSLFDYNPNGSSFAGSAVFQRIATSASARKYFLSSPVLGATVTDLQQGQTFGVLQYSADGFPGDYATVYSPCIRTGGNGTSPQQGSATGLYKTVFGTLTAGRGYSLKQAAGSKTITYTGIPNYDPIDVSSFVNETVDRTASPYFWCPDQNHLEILGNPYPCPIDWYKVHTNSGGTLATYAKIYNGSTYTDLVISGTTELPIYVGQAFFVQVTNPGNVPSPLFDNTTWINDNSKNGTLLRSDNSNVNAKLILKDKQNPHLFDELNLVTNEDAKDGIELKYDAIDWKGEPEVPSMTALQSNGEYSTLQFPTPVKTKKIPLVLDIEHASTYLLSTKIDGTLPGDLQLVLVDKKSKSETLLESGNTISLNLPKGTNANQYEVQYRFGSDVDNISGAAVNDQFYVTSANGTIIVGYNENFNQGSISIYDLSGKQITQKSNISSGNARYEFAGYNENNCFLIKFATENGVQTKKVITK